MCHELIERLEAHLTADKYYSVIANMRGSSAEEVSKRLLDVPGLAGLSVSGARPWQGRGRSGAAAGRPCAALGWVACLVLGSPAQAQPWKPPGAFLVTSP